MLNNEIDNVSVTVAGWGIVSVGESEQSQCGGEMYSSAVAVSVETLWKKDMIIFSVDCSCLSEVFSTLGDDDTVMLFAYSDEAAKQIEEKLLLMLQVDD